MKVYGASSIRNVAIVGHSGAGKTQLASALLFDAGMVNRLGMVDDGTTITDFDEEEVTRKHTLSSSVAVAEWEGKKINLIDTPGMSNFLSDVRAALRVADAALVVVDAVAGVEVQTEKVWNLAADLNLPCLVVLNLLDRERASLDRSLDSLREAFGRTIVPVQLPVGEEKDFRGSVDLLAMTGLTFPEDGSGRPTTGEMPDGLRERAEAAREALIELVAEADDAADGEILRGGHADPDGARGRTARGNAHPSRVPPGVYVRARERRHPAVARRHRRVPAVPRGPAVPGRRPGERRAGHLRHRGGRPRRGLRLEDDCRPVRRPDHALSGSGGDAEGRLVAVQRHEGNDGAPRRSGRHAGEDRQRGRGAAVRRPRRGAEVEG